MWLMAVGVGELGWGQRGGGRENTERKRGEVLGGGGLRGGERGGWRDCCKSAESRAC